jgi:hypothetical protein
MLRPRPATRRGQQRPVQRHQKLAPPHVPQKIFQRRIGRAVARPQSQRKPRRQNLGIARDGEMERRIERAQVRGRAGRRQALQEVHLFVAAPLRSYRLQVGGRGAGRQLGQRSIHRVEARRVGHGRIGRQAGAVNPGSQVQALGQAGLRVE